MLLQERLHEVRLVIKQTKMLLSFSTDRSMSLAMVLLIPFVVPFEKALKEESAPTGVTSVKIPIDINVNYNTL